MWREKENQVTALLPADQPRANQHGPLLGKEGPKRSPTLEE